MFNSNPDENKYQNNENFKFKTNFKASQKISDFLKEAKTAHMAINLWQEKEKQSKAREFRIESKLLRYCQLEKEIAVLKQKLMFNDNNKGYSGIYELITFPYNKDGILKQN